MSVDF